MHILAFILLYCQEIGHYLMFENSYWAFFFSYSRDKYEVLSISALNDSYTYPQEIPELLKNGQWTVSVKARSFHNLALDEAHECIVNRKLKQITTKPSHFRMVD